jgi:hypothetical protein
LDLILDCESETSTCQSLSSLFKCSENDLITLLGDIDIESRQDVPWKSYILQKVIEEFGNNATPNAVCWFHCTRTTQVNTFKEGILPLGEVLSGIWETLCVIFTDTKHYRNLINLQAKGVSGDIYNHRVSNPSRCWGPFAELVRDIAFLEDGTRWDYFELPEIIDDICKGYKFEFDISIRDDVVKALKPCIVKFKSSYKVDNVCIIEGALSYLYGCIQGSNLCIDANYCFDGYNQTISSEDILNIEFIDMA